MAQGGDGKGTRVSLADEERELNVEDEIALRELQLRITTAERILKLFTIANGFVLAFVIVLLLADWFLIGKGLAKVDQRVVDKEVLMALLGATTIQVGAIMFSISAYLFPKKQDGG
ncbi:MAG: hypothetical protein OEU09_01720 [Rhodospirillales bacterium]|nr:hypothetical protein [Rhodospirillales bacterium]MDH3909983.1 hypothetical protein [Rhodospirillales bacterium]